jgi:hypothetical protein
MERRASVGATQPDPERDYIDCGQHGNPPCTPSFTATQWAQIIGAAGVGALVGYSFLGPAVAGFSLPFMHMGPSEAALAGAVAGAGLGVITLIFASFALYGVH